MTCQEALSLLYDVIDKEASQIDAEQVEAHLSQCRHCAEIYKVEQSVNELVREKLSHHESTPRLSSLQSKVLKQLDEIDCADTASDQTDSENPRKSSFIKTGRLLAFAAAIVVILGAAFYGNQAVDEHSRYTPLEQAHSGCLGDLSGFRNPESTDALLASVSEDISYDLTPAVHEYELVGGHLDTINGVEMAHFVYANGQQVVSAFVVPAHVFEIPLELLETQVVRNGVTFFDHNCRGCRLVYHQIGEAVIITATTEREVQLYDFLPGRGTI
jgi:anti-sigma factor (TIGR02949 family)